MWQSVRVACLAFAVAADLVAQQPTTRAAQPSAASQQQPAGIPNVTGLSLDSAQKTLARSKLLVRLERMSDGSRAAPADIVSRQSPLPGQPVPFNRIVSLTLRVTPSEPSTQRQLVPNVTGLTLDSAARVLRVNELTMRLATSRVSRPTPQDVVTQQSPAPRQPIPPDRVVSVAVAIPVAQLAVPNVVGRQIQDASSILARTGFQAGRVTEDDDADVAAGVVVSQNPRDGLRVDPGTRVDLTVRSNRVRVPAILELTEAAATQRLSASGLRVGTVELRDDTAAAGTVIQQSLDARTLVERGSAVSIVVARAVQAVAPQTPPVVPRAPAPRETTVARAPAPTTLTPVSPPQRSIIVPDIVGLTRVEAQAVASRAGFLLVVAPGQSARDADSVVKQVPLARTTVAANGSLVVMAEFVAVPAPRPLWIVWIALAIPILAGAVAFAKTRLSTPRVAFPPLTYTAGARPPSFSITERRSTHGLALSLAVKNDPGVQAVADPRTFHVG